MLKILRKICADRSGLALVEFALILPLFLVMFFGGIEFSRYIITLQKVERSGYALSDITSQFTPVNSTATENDISPENLANKIYPQFKRTMEPYIADDDRIAIITSISRLNNGNNNNSIVINWQSVGGGKLGSSGSTTTSNIAVKSLVNGFTPDQIPGTGVNGAAAGTNPTFPFAADPKLMDGVLRDMAKDENMVIVEAFYNYQPLLSGVLGKLGAVSLAQTTFKSTVFFRPRKGDMLTLVRPPAPLVDTERCNTFAAPYTSANNGSPTFPNPYPPYITPCNYSYSSNSDDMTTCVRTTTYYLCTKVKMCKKCTTPANTAYSDNTGCGSEYVGDSRINCSSSCTGTSTAPNCPAPTPVYGEPPPN